MWFFYKLDNENQGEGMVYCRLRPNRTYSMGRKGADIMLYNDKSISKHHASIRTDPMAVDKLDDINYKPQLFYTDNSSKYGSKINDQQVTETTELNNGDILSLGSFGMKLRVYWVPYVLCRQGITSSDKRNLFLLASSLGVHIVNEWTSECTHLLVTNFTATTKVLRCFVDAKPMVTPEWLGQALHTNDMEFDPATQISAQTIYNYGPLKKDVSMGINNERKRTFAHKEFYFFEQDQFIANQYLIEGLGGTAKMKDINRFDTTKELLRNNKVNQPILIEPSSHTQEDDAWVALGLQLSECDIRVIPEYEIGYAIIYGSSSIACNPKAPTKHIEDMERHHHHQTTTSSAQPSLGNFTFDFSLTMASFQNDSTLSIAPITVQGHTLDNNMFDDMMGEPSGNRAETPVKQEAVENPSSLSLGSLVPQKRTLPPTSSSSSSNKRRGNRPVSQSTAPVVDDQDGRPGPSTRRPENRPTESHDERPGPSTRRPENRPTESHHDDNDDDDLFSDIFSMSPTSTKQKSSGQPESSGSSSHRTTQNEQPTLPFNDNAERTIPYNAGDTQPYNAGDTQPYSAGGTQPCSAGDTQPYNEEKTLPYGEPSNMDRTIPYTEDDKTVPYSESSNMDRTIPYAEDDKTVPYNDDGYPSINMDDGQHNDDDGDGDDFNILDGLELTQPHRNVTQSSHRSSTPRQNTQSSRVAATSSLQRDTSANTQDKPTEHRPTSAPGTIYLDNDDDDDDDFDWMVAPERTTPRTTLQRASTQPGSTLGTTDQRTQHPSTIDTESQHDNILDDIPPSDSGNRGSPSQRRVLPSSQYTSQERTRSTPSRSLEASHPNQHSLEVSPPPPTRAQTSTPVAPVTPQAAPPRQSTPVASVISQTAPSTRSTRQTTLDHTTTRRTRSSQQASSYSSRRNVAPPENETEEMPPIEPGKQYTVVEYAPLVVASRPPYQAERPTSNGINYKPFKKVNQFQDHALLDVINLISTTQSERDQNNSERRQAVNGLADPDLFIRGRPQRAQFL